MLLCGIAALCRQEEAMADQEQPVQQTPDQEEATEKKEMRVMWIMTAVIVVVILGLVGMNMLTHPDWMHGG
jgi:hypothetical protein